jgi:peptide/nickel transport system substrate-binding protein
MRSQKLLGLLAILLIASLVLTACGGQTTSGDTPEETAGDTATDSAGDDAPAGGGTVVVGTTDAISSLDFADAYAIHDWELFRNVNVGLMTFEPGTATVVPGAAASYEVSEDGLTYTFTLDTGWAYPDGSELVAGDFVRGITRALTLEGDVSGLVVPYVESVEAPDDQTVVFNLDNPRGDFVQIITGAAYMPVAEGAYPDDALNKFPETVSGVGAWQVTEYNIEEQLVLERNPNYKLGFADNAPTQVIIRYFQDATQMALAVENGEIDIAWRILGPPEVQRLSGVEGLTAYDSGGGGIRYLVPNHIMEPFTSKEVRQALAYLLDRDEIVDRVMQGTVNPLYSQVPPGFIGANEAFLDIYGSSPDIAAAEALLESAGYSADNPVVFDLWYPPEHYGTHAAQIFQVLEEQFEATPMVQVNLQSQEWGTYVGALVGGEYPIGYLGWFFDYPDTSNYLDPFAQSEASASLGVNYASEEMDELLRQGGESSDAGEREVIYTDAQNLYAEDVVTIPITLEPEFAVFNNATVNNIVIGPALYFQYELIELSN